MNITGVKKKKNSCMLKNNVYWKTCEEIGEWDKIGVLWDCEIYYRFFSIL